MVSEFPFNSKPVRVSLEKDKKMYLPGSAHLVFELKPAAKEKTDTSQVTQ